MPPLDNGLPQPSQAPLQPAHAPGQPAQAQAPLQPAQAPVQAAQAPGPDLNAGRLPQRGDIQQRTAEEYSTKINQSPSYKVDSIRGDGVIVRGQVTFHRTDGNDRAGGGYFSGADGVRHHNTGTTDDGRVIAGHRVEKDGSVKMSRGQGPTVFTSELNDLIDQLGLKQDQVGSLTFTRRGFSGQYKIQIEDNGSFSVHYTGGTNAAGERCYAQTYHRGSWDEGRPAMLSEKSQRDRWTKRNAREHGDETAVSTAHHEQVAKAKSGFHTSTSSSVVTDNGNLTTQAAPITTEAIRTNIAKITADTSTWSGTYVHIPAAEGKPGVPPSYSFARQHNNTSGILNIKQATLDALAGEQTLIRSVYTLAVNSYDESNQAKQGFRSLLTDKKMLLTEGGKETVVTLSGNGDVIDHTNGFKYSIQVKDGQPISWTKAPYVEQTNQPSLQSAPKPSAAPNLGETAGPATPTTVDKLQAEAIEVNRCENRYNARNFASRKLREESTTSSLIIDPKLQIHHTDDTATRSAMAAGIYIKSDRNDASAYVFPRKIGNTGGILLVKENELTADKSEAAKIVAATYKAKTQTSGDIITEGKKEEWHKYDATTKTRIRSDGSVEVHKTPAGGAPAVYSIIAPYKKDGGGLDWKVIPAELDAQGRLVKQSTPPANPKTEPKISADATDIARKIYSNMVGNIFYDDEKAFVQLVEQAQQKMLLREVDYELKRLFNTHIRQIIKDEGEAGWTGISKEDLAKLETALKDHKEAPTNKYEPVVSKGPSGMAPSMPYYSPSLGGK